LFGASTTAFHGAPLAARCCLTPMINPNQPLTLLSLRRKRPMRPSDRLAMRFLLLTAAILPMAGPGWALDGQIGIHDPSTVIRCDGKYYTFGTGGGSLVSEDGWTWRRGVAPGSRGLAPDIIHLEDRYCVYVARNVGAQPGAEVSMISSKT